MREVPKAEYWAAGRDADSGRGVPATLVAGCGSAFGTEGTSASEEAGSGIGADSEGDTLLYIGEASDGVGDEGWPLEEAAVDDRG